MTRARANVAEGSKSRRAPVGRGSARASITSWPLRNTCEPRSRPAEPADLKSHDCVMFHAKNNERDWDLISGRRKVRLWPDVTKLQESARLARGELPAGIRLPTIHAPDSAC